MMKYLIRDRAVSILLLLTSYIYSSGSIGLEHNYNETVPLNIAIIGAGTTGLVSAKHSISQGHNVTVYEQNEEIGGTWVYTDEVGRNKYGINIQTAMYSGLRSNAPYQLMGFPEFPNVNYATPFPSHSDVLKFLQYYSNHFELKKNIKFNHLVIRVLPIDNNKWELVVKDLPNNKFMTEIFDAVFVCNGHFFAPRFPEIDGWNKFSGKQIHSHDFRKPEKFRDEDVLIIGAGHSGAELAIQLSNVAKSVTLSQRKQPNESEESRQRRMNALPPKTILKYEVKRLLTDGTEFFDDTQQIFSSIIYATGYKYSYPFLSVDTGIFVEENFVQPLYKQIFNIHHPSMAFIGITKSSVNFPLYDLQVRFALKFLSGAKKLPPKEEMVEDQRREAQILFDKGYKKGQAHSLLPIQRKYLSQISELANITNLPRVLDDVADDIISGLHCHPTEFRNFKYSIIDDKIFIKEKCEGLS